jgi:two-component system CheB/CheR fusion protein
VDQLRASLLRDDNGQPRGAVVVILDVSRERLATEHRELLLAELNHRVKNSLATVQAIALQTLASADGLDAFRKDFLARLQALSASHGLLAEHDWRGTGVREVAGAILAPYQRDGAPRVHVAGPDVRLTPGAALAIGLALHELATNAAKYGALSTDEGAVELQWRLREQRGARWLDIDWIEGAGPPVVAPTRRGFGTRLLVDGLRHELEAEVSLDFAASGLRCAIRIPLPAARAP